MDDTLPGKEPRPTEMHAEVRGKTEWVVEECSNKYQLRLVLEIRIIIILWFELLRTTIMTMANLIKHIFN